MSLKLIQRKKVQGISQEYAQVRAQLISDVRYHLNLSIDGKKNFYEGSSTVYFTLTQQADLTLDFSNGKVKALEINGQKIKKTPYNNLFISLSEKYLKKGENEVKVTYSHPYSKNGVGFYRFVDPQDKHVYTYTHFEPYDANQLFPCFDQPDLKAHYTLQVEAPSTWVVVSSAREKKVKKTSHKSKLWQFPETALFSTYLFSLHAGPYKIWNSKAGSIPIRLMARKSLAQYAPIKEWFVITQQGLQFFGKYFNYPYPFKKYDQLLVPDFNMGAMENVAAVTFSERLISRGKMTYKERERLAEVILHEMAHMWFGDLVTMQWWNDLWLNESFATYISYVCMVSATEFKSSWESFYTDIKQWAYWEDQLVTTHPIVAEVPDTQQAFANFDGITYGKGASVLKQLHYYVGLNQFRDGLRHYFKKYAFKNTEMVDFINSLARASNLNLKSWTKSWLNTESLNTVEAIVSYEDGKIKKFELQQTHDEKYPYFRPHKTEMGLYDLVGDQIKLRKSLPLTYQKHVTEVAELEHEAQPALIYPNHGDYDFVKIKLDDETLKTAQNHLSHIEDSFVRAMFWQSLWDMVRDAEIPPAQYLDLLMENLKNEKEINIATTVTRKIRQALNYLPEGTGAREKYKGDVEFYLWNVLERAQPKTDFQKLWFDNYVKAAYSENGLNTLHEILLRKKIIPGLDIDQDRRWGIIIQLHRYNWNQCTVFKKQELKKDPSENGQQMAISAEVIMPAPSVKKKWFDKITHPNGSLSLMRLKHAMSHLFPSEQKKLQEDFVQPYFKSLPTLIKKADNEFLSAYTETLTPSFGTETSVKTLNDFISKNKKLPPIVKKHLLIAHQEDERTLKIRQLSAKF